MSEPGGDPSSGISSGDALILPERHPACRRREARPGFRMERENLCFVTSNDVKGQATSGSNREGESTEAGRRGGAARSSVEGPVMGPERRGCVVQPWPLANWKREEPVDEAKPFKQRPDIGSRVTREGHARFWERPEVKFLRATRQTEKVQARPVDLQQRKHLATGRRSRSGRVEDGRGSLWPMANAPFPIPAGRQRQSPASASHRS